ncbi:MAG TPA: hypothetical protein VGK29_16605 [Paludibaculum sp.]|jgi:hypothetical protein
MQRKAVLTVLFVCAVAVMAIFLPLPGQQAQAQQKCPSFQALAQEQLLNPELLLRTEDIWGGPVHGYLGDEPLHGRTSGNDGTVTWHKWVGMGKGGTLYFDFGMDSAGNHNTFTTVATQGTFPNPPGQFPAGGMYQGAHKITSGTGRFLHATGNLFVKGPYVVWDLDKELPQGRFNAEVSGNVCGVQ